MILLNSISFGFCETARDHVDPPGMYMSGGCQAVTMKDLLFFPSSLFVSPRPGTVASTTT